MYEEDIFRNKNGVVTRSLGEGGQGMTAEEGQQSAARGLVMGVAETSHETSTHEDILGP